MSANDDQSGPPPAMAGRLTRRGTLRALGVATLVAPAILRVGAGGRSFAAETSAKIVSYSSAGQRWEFPEKGVYPLFQRSFPNTDVTIVAEPIADMLPKSALAIASKTDRYDTMFIDYNYQPQFVAQHGLEPLEPYLDKDPAYKADILADIPENVLDLYRDKPAAQGGVLYGLPPDSNTPLQYYRADVLEKAGFPKPATTWEDAIEIAKALSDGGKKRVVGTSLKRGFWAGTVLITLLRSHGGDWFDKMGPGGWKPQLDSEEGHLAFDTLMKLAPYLDPTALNASDDESNAAMLNGTWLYAPAQWGGSTMNDPKFTQFADAWKVAVVPKGANAKGRFAPHMGGLGFVIPVWSKNKDATWEWIKFCCSGDRQDPAIGKAWVENTGQPARLSLLRQYSTIRPYFSGLMESLPLAMRFLPIPESNALYEMVGTEVSNVVTGGKAPAEALKSMQAQATRLMTKGGYYKQA